LQLPRTVPKCSPPGVSDTARIVRRGKVCVTARCPSDRPSVCLSHLSTVAAECGGGFAAGTGYRSTAARRAAAALRCQLGIIMHRCRHGKAPQYLVDCCTPVTDVVGRQRLMSATQQLTVVPRHRLSTVGSRAFAVHGSMAWNSLPDYLRAQQDYESFRQGLKTWLFSRY